VICLTNQSGARAGRLIQGRAQGFSHTFQIGMDLPQTEGKKEISYTLISSAPVVGTSRLVASPMVLRAPAVPEPSAQASAIMVLESTAWAVKPGSSVRVPVHLVPESKEAVVPEFTAKASMALAS